VIIRVFRARPKLGKAEELAALVKEISIWEKSGRNEKDDWR